ncbi:agmatine deiminase [Entomoplasma freundtii]|uniref:Putative agmatine deiminase n=1 Tax=Entomoplasma freundtii TaxID=74700 RepID=A0A2K8NRT0_9MOLU|nr:agmatine deiminase [Entomoplasma freundtii]ATZ16474.1 agmatine deiminase [Entomoplasma freundtii]TDY56003.1 agmatine deiminase [Entomoplasma freundtii]
MSKRLKSTPREDGFKMPGEFVEQDSCWMAWPQRTDVWRGGAKPIQEAVVNVANAISKYEPLNVIVSAGEYENARARLGKNVRVIETSSNDIWMRDIGPSFVINDKGEIRGIDWIFNCWGGFNGGYYFPWDLDDKAAFKVCELIGADSYRTDFVLEGGSIHVDGEGTCYTTEECLLNKNRNPDLTKKQIEDRLKKFLNVEKVIWLPLGVYNDKTSGHVDNLLHVVAPGHVVLTWTDDKNDPQYERSLKALKVLENETDAQGRKIKVTKIHQPGPLFYTEKEVSTLGYNLDKQCLHEVERLAGSYCNFLMVNGAIILPVFNDKWDQKAIDTLQKIFPDRKIEPVYAREILLGGGNIHCITQHQPKVKNKKAK